MKKLGIGFINSLLGSNEIKKEPIVIEESVEEIVAPIEDGDVDDSTNIVEIAIHYLGSDYTAETVTRAIVAYAKSNNIELTLDDAEKIAEYAGKFGYDPDQFEDMLHQKM